jgi:hypothetical protein
MAVRWLIFALFVVGMFSSLNSYEGTTRERRMAFGLAAIVAFALVLVLGSTMA